MGVDRSGGAVRVLYADCGSRQGLSNFRSTLYTRGAGCRRIGGHGPRGWCWGDQYRGTRQRLLVTRIVSEGYPHLEGLALVLGGHGVGLLRRAIDLSVGCGFQIEANPLVGKGGVHYAVLVLDTGGGRVERLSSVRGAFYARPARCRAVGGQFQGNRTRDGVFGLVVEAPFSAGAGSALCVARPTRGECNLDVVNRIRLQHYLPDSGILIDPPSSGYLSAFHVEEVGEIGSYVDLNWLTEHNLEDDFATGAAVHFRHHRELRGQRRQQPWICFVPGL